MINRLLVWLGLREPDTFTAKEMAEFEKIGWKWYGGYGVGKSNDWIIFGDIATAERSTTEEYECDHSTSVNFSERKEDE